MDRSPECHYRAAQHMGGQCSSGIGRDGAMFNGPMYDDTSPNAGKNGVDRFRTAQTLLAKGAPLHALTELEPLLQEQPGSRSVLELAARAYFKSAQLSRAEQTFARLVELDPTDSYARFALGRSVERQSRHAEAAGHYRVACALDPRDDYREALARVEKRIS